MHHPAREPIYEAISSVRLIDPHTHINPHAAGSTTLADLLGYHYYTELAHSAGMPKAEIEQEGLPPRELVGRLVANLGPIENTAQYRWLIEICRNFFGFDGERLDESNWEAVYDSAENQMRHAEWPQMVLDQSNVEAVFLTNDFDDPLTGFDTDTYIPCLRTDDLVFHLAKYQTRQRLEACTGIELDGSLRSLRDSLKQRFEHFVAAGARACAISLPPSFEPTPISDGRAATALDEILRKGALADDSHQVALSRRVFWTLAELCDEFGLPFDLMIGVNRGVYAGGVFQGQDLYDSRVSLIQYRELFNSFSAVKFPISVLASVTNQELVSYAWIFPNVITNGHWWYSNTPSFIARDASTRLEAVPRTKQIAYYSDAYKLEFVWPKFDMYRRILSGILADQFVGENGWSEERAIEFGRQVLRGNVDEIFPPPRQREASVSAEISGENLSSATSESLATGGIGVVTVDDDSASGQSGDEIVEFTTIVDSEFVQSSDDRAGQGFETIVEELPTSHQDDDQDDMGARLDQFGIDSELIDRPTVVDNETVREDLEEQESAPKSFSAASADTVEESLGDDPLPLDPIPNADEIQSLELDDVELIDGGAATAADSAVIEADADSEPLDVGDLLGDDDPSSTSEVRMLRGESSFMPDEDSLQLRSNPLTGELMFQVPTDDGLPPDSPTDDDMLVVESPELADDVEDVDESSRDDTGETSSDDEARRS
jgi:glucuronate isomerase